MIRTDILANTVLWSRRSVITLVLLTALPNLLGMFNIATPWGFKWHCFQVAVFFSASLFGPIGGLLSGLAGSLVPALITGNPYIIVGNALLGALTGLLLKRGIAIVPAVWLACAIQLPWLIATDYYLVGLSAPFIKALVIGLFISNTVWALVAQFGTEPLRRWLR
jgi:uncharacterized membrane protein